VGITVGSQAKSPVSAERQAPTFSAVHEDRDNGFGGKSKLWVVYVHLAGWKCQCGVGDSEGAAWRRACEHMGTQIAKADL
jgi:hypothetical protein